MHYYSFNIGDYTSSTQHLEPLEDLAYRRMLDLYYSKELPLPKDLEKIARLIRMRTHTDSIAIVLEEFFTKEKDGYHNKGADKALGKVYKKSEAARKSAEARWNKNKDLESCERNANASKPHCEENANGMLPNTQDTIPNTQDTIPNTQDKDPLSANADAISVLTYLNEIFSSKYKHTTKSHIENINARLAEGHSIEDCKAVIDSKFREWGDDSRMAGYLRPSTLFSAGKFQGYLMAAKTAPTKSKHDLSNIEYKSGSF